MREQSAWLLPATPRAQREEETVGAERRGPAAAAAAVAASQQGPCSRAPERLPQPRPPLLTPPPALGPLQQSAGSAASEGAGSPRRELALSAQSRGLRPSPDPRPPPDSLKGPAVLPRAPRPADPVPEQRPRRCPSGAARITAPCASRRRTRELSPVFVFLTLPRRAEEKGGVCLGRVKVPGTPPLNSRSPASSRLQPAAASPERPTPRERSAAASGRRASTAWAASGRPRTPAGGGQGAGWGRRRHTLAMKRLSLRPERAGARVQGQSREALVAPLLGPRGGHAPA